MMLSRISNESWNNSESIMKDYSIVIPDELLRIVTPLVPVSQWRRVAYEAFNLTVHEVDAIESAPTRCDAIFHLLHQAVQRDQMPAKVLKQKIEDARACGMKVGWKESEKIEAGDGLPSPTMLYECSTQLSDYELFLVGYMGYTFEEIASNMHNTSDYKSCVLKMLSLWRCKDGKVKTIEELLSALEMVSYLPIGVVKSAVNEWLDRSERSSVVTADYMQTVMPVSKVETIQSHLKTIYRSTLSTLCPLPWLGEAADAQFSFNEVFIPLRTSDVHLLQKTLDGKDSSTYDVTGTRTSSNSSRTSRKRKNGQGILRPADVQENLDVDSDCNRVASMNDLLVIGVAKPDITKARCILVQSVAGGGKSTLCQQLAYQWAMNSGFIQRLASFPLVFLIKINLIRKEDVSIYDYIHRELLHDQGNIVDTIKDLKMLFIVDGYDELSGNSVVVEDLLVKRVCPQATVIVTTRDGQTPSLQYFSNGFRIQGLSSSDVQTFLTKLPRNSENKILTKINLNVHPLGPILSTPLFLWFYYLLGEEIFKGIDIASRTNLFSKVIAGIQQKAVQRLNKTDKECAAAVKELEQIAYNCLRQDKLHFDDHISELAANIGLVKQTKSHMHLRNYTTYTFTHKSFAEYLTARYVIRSNEVIKMLQQIPEIRSLARRKVSLILYFVCGLVYSKEHIFEVFDTFVWKKKTPLLQYQSHDNHFSLQCIAELPDNLVSRFKTDRVIQLSRYIEILGRSCTQYCVLGLKRACDRVDYTLESLRLVYKGKDITNMLGDHKNVNLVVKSAKNNVLKVTNQQSDEMWAVIGSYYRGVDTLTLHSCFGSLPPRCFSAITHVKHIDCSGKFTCHWLRNTNSQCVKIMGRKKLVWQLSNTEVLHDVSKNKLSKFILNDISMTRKNISDMSKFIQISKLSTLKLWDLFEWKENQSWNVCLLSDLFPAEAYPSLQELNVWCKNCNDVESVSQFIQQCRHLVTFGYKCYVAVLAIQEKLWDNVLNICADLSHIRLYRYFSDIPLHCIKQSLMAMSLKQRRKLKIMSLCIVDLEADHQMDITDQIAGLIPGLQQ